MILAFDTSLPRFSVALLDGMNLLGSFAAEGRRSRNEKLLPAVDFLLTEAGATISDVTTIVVTRGPGSFTGVRIGLATAQGLAFASSSAIFPVSTHLPVASRHGTTIVIGEAGRGDVYMSRIKQWGVAVEPVLVPRDSVSSSSAELTVIDIDEWSTRRNLALEAGLLVANGSLQPEPLAPLYVRPSAAEEKLLRGEL